MTVSALETSVAACPELVPAAPRVSLGHRNTNAGSWKCGSRNAAKAGDGNIEVFNDKF
jgi:hypothetical protein